MTNFLLGMALLVTPQSDIQSRLSAIDALVEESPGPDTDIQKWLEKCYTMADTRGRLIIEFYRRYPNHERSPKLIDTRWGDFIGHVQVPKMPRLDMIRDDIAAYLKTKPTKPYLAIAKQYEAKEVLLRQWRIAKDNKIKLTDPSAKPLLDKAEKACLAYQKAFQVKKQGSTTSITTVKCVRGLLENGIPFATWRSFIPNPDSDLERLANSGSLMPLVSRLT